ncbi:PhoX family phosphatase [Rothia sp. AR01]|uniref:PhoX family phosphatase n=1 Tax=Rothia santali TaxID=2949643 RepID=A0A9X2HBH8_9MICC|nr:PhoX family phosphatase [Rothia santali]MCP3426261.1 PhoX family phosphatase [Rothia santali]
MAEHVRGKRSAVTCLLKCGNACAEPVANSSGNGYFRDVAQTALSRRAALGIGAAAAVVVGGAEAARGGPGGGPAGPPDGVGVPFSFGAIDPVPSDVDELTVPGGWAWEPIVRWGDPLFPGAPALDPEHQTAEAQAQQFGYNNDFLAILPDGPGALTGLLVCNHEYTNEEVMFPAAQWSTRGRELRRAAMAAHGMSVVELVREEAGGPWSYVVGGARNRRIHLDTPFRLSGPAAGSELLRTEEDPAGTTVLGTLNNCSGGVTPWGTVLSGEENVNSYFVGSPTEEEKRFEITASPTAHGWESVQRRWNLGLEGCRNEANRFGWIVEVDPQDPTSTPVKRTALGRFKHEGANVRVDPATGRVVAYMGDDSRFEYLYKFVSRDAYREGDAAHNRTLLDHGDLFVAKFAGNSPAGEIDGEGGLPSDGAFDGTGEWIPLTRDGASAVPGMSIDQVLVNTRAAGDAVGATAMDRPEDVEPSPVSGLVYVALTNNTDRGAKDRNLSEELPADEANPRTKNRDGHVLELSERGGSAVAERFDWSILLVCGDPAEDSSAYFAGFDPARVSPISCPDNLAFDSTGRLWISTDGAPSNIGYNDGLFRVGLEGGERGRVEQFLSVPVEAETCGPVVHDAENMVYVAVQHPGEDGSHAAPSSFFPDYVPERATPAPGQVRGPRPAVVQVYRP